MVYPSFAGASAGLTHHHRLAGAAKEFGGQQVIVLGLVTGRGLFVFLHLALHPLKQIHRDQSRNAIWHHDIAVLVFTDILPVVENARDEIQVCHFAPHRCNPQTIQMIHDLFHGGACVVHLENIQHNGGCNRVRLVLLVRINSEAKSGRTAVVLALEGIFGVTANDLYGKFRRIIFCHTLQHGFQNNALWAIGNVFFCRHHPHAILFQDSLIMGTVIAIAGKTVQLPNHNHIKQPLRVYLRSRLICAKWRK